MDGKNDLKLLSEREETQFRDMILGLLVSVGYKGIHQTVMSCSGCAFIVRSPSQTFCSWYIRPHVAYSNRFRPSIQKPKTLNNGSTIASLTEHAPESCIFLHIAVCLIEFISVSVFVCRSTYTSGYTTKHHLRIYFDLSFSLFFSFAFSFYIQFCCLPF